MKLKKFLPPTAIMGYKTVRARVALYRASFYDRERFLRFSSTISPHIARHNLASRITESYHNLEKGLSLPSPRPLFGRDRVEVLLGYLESYLTQYGVDETSSAAIAALGAYVDFNLASGQSIVDIPHFSRINAMLQISAVRIGGTKSVNRNRLRRITAEVPIDFFESRNSVRQFTSTPVTRAEVEFATRVALKSPAVCNRQFSKIYLAQEPDMIELALRVQGGARGFANSVPAVVVITTNLRSYWGVGERTQAWSDGGMFAMSFLLGLHAQGLGAVCLNWSKTPSVDKAFRSQFDIPDDEVVVMLIAFGHTPDDYAVAFSPRPEVETAICPLVRKI